MKNVKHSPQNHKMYQNYYSLVLLRAHRPVPESPRSSDITHAWLNLTTWQHSALLHSPHWINTFLWALHRRGSINTRSTRPLPPLDVAVAGNDLAPTQTHAFFHCPHRVDAPVRTTLRSRDALPARPLRTPHITLAGHDHAVAQHGTLHVCPHGVDTPIRTFFSRGLRSAYGARPLDPLDAAITWYNFAVGETLAFLLRPYGFDTPVGAGHVDGIGAWDTGLSFEQTPARPVVHAWDQDAARFVCAPLARQAGRTTLARTTRGIGRSYQDENEQQKKGSVRNHGSLLQNRTRMWENDGCVFGRMVGSRLHSTVSGAATDYIELEKCFRRQPYYSSTDARRGMGTSFFVANHTS